MVGLSKPFCFVARPNQKYQLVLLINPCLQAANMHLLNKSSCCLQKHLPHRGNAIQSRAFQRPQLAYGMLSVLVVFLVGCFAHAVHTRNMMFFIFCIALCTSRRGRPCHHALRGLGADAHNSNMQSHFEGKPNIDVAWILTARRSMCFFCTHVVSM